MNERALQEQICEIGRRLYQRGYVSANDGNISVRLNDREILCTPTMISKGFMRPEDICKVDYEGNQLAGHRKRTSEIFLHLAVYKHRPDVMAVVHAHPPHATAFAVAHEPIPKCILPEVEVFLGEVPIAEYETPGGQAFANTIVPYLPHTNTILLANHGTITFGPDLEKAYWNTEIIDSYCKILLLARQLGRVNYISDTKARELLTLKQRLGYDDPRFHEPGCPICGPGLVIQQEGDFVPEPYAFRRDVGATCGPCATNGHVQETQPLGLSPMDLEAIVQRITDEILRELSRT
ncbi:MAG: class II aldolase/adducin family protein [Gemmatales bacterium]|nr:class II aldolase/adducin family protein [Gemmatales bacterium]MDW7995054.1 class II aldolase/adducin family protein [Gemmatales bacterium]